MVSGCEYFPTIRALYPGFVLLQRCILLRVQGRKGMSALRRVEIKTGKVVQSVNLDQNYFGEGNPVQR